MSVARPAPAACTMSLFPVRQRKLSRLLGHQHQPASPTMRIRAWIYPTPTSSKTPDLCSNSLLKMR